MVVLGKVTASIADRVTERSALRVALVFIIVSVVWILFSDRAVIALNLDVVQSEKIQSLKGVIYVGFVGVIIYILSLRTYRSIELAHQYETQAALDLVTRLAVAMEYRDDHTGSHIYRQAELVHLIAKAYGMGEEQSKLVSQAAMLHDVGKIGVRDEVLMKPGPLTDAEREEMQRHVTIGSCILQDGKHPLIHLGAKIVASHHENWDGTGYPEGISGEAIPVEARIVAVCDVFDALISRRPYKEAWYFHDAVEEIRRLSGTKFDPKVVAAFEKALPQIERIERI